MREDVEEADREGHQRGIEAAAHSGLRRESPTEPEAHSTTEQHQGEMARCQHTRRPALHGCCVGGYFTSHVSLKLFL